jgi:hypothetical protein
VDSAKKEFKIDVGHVTCAGGTKALGEVDILCTQNTAHFVASASTPPERHALKLALIKALKDLEEQL